MSAYPRVTHAARKRQGRRWAVRNSLPIADGPVGRKEIRCRHPLDRAVWVRERVRPCVACLGGPRSGRIVFLESGTYQWVDLVHFRRDSSCDDRSAVALLSHPRYRESYTSARVDSVDVTIEVHGPYWLDRIEVAAFEPLPQADAVLLRDWSDESSTDGKNLAELEHAVYPLVLEATSVRKLRDLDDAARIRALGKIRSAREGAPRTSRGGAPSEDRGWSPVSGAPRPCSRVFLVPRRVS